MAATTVSLKLLIDPKSQRVLFAEAGKDFVDFIFNILSLPVGTVIRLLTKQGMVGCLGNVYDSIEKLGDTYMQSTANKDALLKPMVSNYSANVPLLLPNMESPTSSTLYRCSSYPNVNCCVYVANDPKSICLACKSVMNKQLTFVNQANDASSSSEGGYVKGVVTYMIMDDLVVRPMSTISSITLLNKFNIKDVGVLEEKVIDMGMDESKDSATFNEGVIVVKISESPCNSVPVMALTTVSLKLLVESTSQRVLFAEAGKDFVDFLFNILSLPVGTVIGLLTKQDMMGGALETFAKALKI